MPHKLELVRGFVEEAELSLSCLPRLGRLWELAPLLRRLKISPDAVFGTEVRQPHIEREFTASYFTKLRSLELSLNGAGNAAAQIIANAPVLANLRELHLHLSVWGEGIALYGVPAETLILDDDGAGLLAASPHLVNVEHLVLDTNRITNAGLHALARGRWKIRHLELAHNRLDGATLAACLDGPAFQQLEVLGLSGTLFDASGLRDLVRSPTLACLRELDLEKCHLGVDGTKALCSAFALPSLRRLRLERNSLCDAGAITLAECDRLANLTSFEAGHNRIGQKGAAAIASSPHFAKLERLTLNEPRWKPETAALFAASPTLAATKIYLQGRLVARGKKSAAELAKPKKASVDAAPIVPGEVAKKPKRPPRFPKKK
jgi:Leucine Rich repeat